MGVKNLHLEEDQGEDLKPGEKSEKKVKKKKGLALSRRSSN